MIFFKKLFTQSDASWNKKINKKSIIFHVSYVALTHGDSTQSLAMMCSQGVTRRILTLQGEIYEKKNV
jgi:hypothetical protein